MRSLAELCKSLGVNYNTAYRAVVRGAIDGKVVKRKRVTYTRELCVDPIDFQLWARSIGEHNRRGERVVAAFNRGVDPEDIAEQLGIQVASVWRTLQRRGGIQKRHYQDRAAKQYRSA